MIRISPQIQFQKKLLSSIQPALYLLWGITLMILAIIPVLIYKSRTWPLLWDAAVFHYMAWLITEGAVPYRDIFDVQFPGTYIVHLFIINLFGGGDVAWRVFDLSCLVIIDALIILFCRPFGKLAVFIGVALFSAFHLYNGPLYTGQRDYYLIMFIIAGMYFVARHIENSKFKPHLLVVGGVFLGAAVSIKPYAGLLCLVLLAIVFFFAVRGGLKWLKPLILFTVSASLVPGLLMLWLWVIGGLQPFFDILFNYLLPFYSKFTFQPFTETVLRSFSGFPSFEIIIVATIALVNIVINKELRPRRMLLLTGMLYGFFHFIFQGRNSYQLYPFVFFAFLIVASWSHDITRKIPGLLKCIMFLILLHCCLLALYRSSSTLVAPPLFHITNSKCKENLVQDLHGRVSSGDTVQVMDTISGGIYALYAMRYKQPTRFLYDAPFFHDRESDYIQNLRNEFLHDLKTRPPLYFVLSKRSWPINGYERLDTFPELREWLSENYILDIERGGYRLYRVK